MEQDFKKWLNLHKGKELTNEMIEIISKKHENEIFDMLYIEGLVMQSVNTGKTINPDGQEKDWAVKNYQWQTEKEFKTLKGAIKYCNQ